MARVVVHGVDAARLLTIGPTHSYWRTRPLSAPAGSLWAGALVRVRPPAGATDADVTYLQGELARLGVVHVKVEPRATQEGVVVEDDGPDPQQPSRSTRQVVTARASRARNVLDPERLMAVLDAAMDEAGI